MALMMGLGKSAPYVLGDAPTECTTCGKLGKIMVVPGIEPCSVRQSSTRVSGVSGAD
jgi:hypothetical protein